MALPTVSQKVQAAKLGASANASLRHLNRPGGLFCQVSSDLVLDGFVSIADQDLEKLRGVLLPVVIGEAQPEGARVHVYYTSTTEDGTAGKSCGGLTTCCSASAAAILPCSCCSSCSCSSCFYTCCFFASIVLISSWPDGLLLQLVTVCWLAGWLAGPVECDVWLSQIRELKIGPSTMVNFQMPPPPMLPMPPLDSPLLVDVQFPPAYKPA